MHWYALCVKPQHEKSVAEQLEQQALESYLPLYKAKRRWSDRTKTVEMPLFSRYVFSRFDFENRMKVLRIASVNRIVGFGGKPYPIEETVIGSLRDAIGSGLPCSPWPFIKEGDRVRVFQGAMEGTEGILVRQKNLFRVVINVELLNRAVAVEVDKDSVRPCQPIGQNSVLTATGG